MLTGKYLKYKPEITFEIFQKIWDKLIENGWKCVGDSECDEEYESFKIKGYFSESYTPMYFNSYAFSSGIQTTVEELLGYNPFETKSKPFKAGDKLVGKSIIGSDITASSNPLGVVNKYFIADEIEYIDDKTVKLWSNRSYWNCNISDISIYQEIKSDEEDKFKPSTREAYDSQFKSKSIEKWSVGSYVVCIEDYGSYFKVGDVAQLEDGVYKIDENCVNLSKWAGHPCMPFKDSCEWFATLQEAEEFSKTLLKPKEYEWSGLTPKNHIGAIYKMSYEQAVDNYMELRGISMQESSIQLVNVPRI